MVVFNTPRVVKWLLFAESFELRRSAAMLAATVHSLRSKYRATLLEAYTAYCAHEPSLPLSGFLTFADSFDISSYLSAERVADIFEQVISTPARRGGKGSISFEEFKEAICLCALAVSDKQWQARPPPPLPHPPAAPIGVLTIVQLPQVEYSAEKRVRFQYRRADADKSHVAPQLEQASSATASASTPRTAAPSHPGRALIAVFSLNRRSSSCSRR